MNNFIDIVNPILGMYKFIYQVFHLQVIGGVLNI